MSASTKKKLRKEQVAAELTEKQLTEQTESKKVKTMTIVFVIVLALIVCVAAVTAVARTVNFKGIMERNTNAVTIGDHHLNSTEFNYYYMDAVNNFYGSMYQNYQEQTNTYIKMMYNLDCTIPLEDQLMDEESGETWADYFLETAKTNAQFTLAMYDDATKNGYTLNEEDAAELANEMESMEKYVATYGFSSVEHYLTSKYGRGAERATYEEYFKQSFVANKYYNEYAEQIDYTTDELREYEAPNPELYDAYSFSTVFLNRSYYLEDTTTESDDSTDTTEATVAEPTPEEYADALAAALADANLLAETATDVESLDEAYLALAVNDTERTSTKYTNKNFDEISSVIRSWVTDPARTENEIAVLPYEATNEDADGNPVTEVLGYYIVLFQGKIDNVYPLANVRHILISLEGGTQDENGKVTYSDEEKAAAKEKAEAILADWEAGEKTEDSFAVLAAKHTTDAASKDNGGLYVDVLPGQMVTEFEDWCFDESREAGDTGIIETTYGYHVMFYSGDSEENYRDYLISNDLRAEKLNTWHDDIVEALTVKVDNLKFINTRLVLSAS